MRSSGTAWALVKVRNRDQSSFHSSEVESKSAKVGAAITEVVVGGATRPTKRDSQGLEAWLSCLFVASPLALGTVALEHACQHVAVRPDRGTVTLAPAFLPVVAEVAIASVRRSSPWVSVTAAEEHSSSFRTERILVASKTLVVYFPDRVSKLRAPCTKCTDFIRRR